jgi:hypothetical protein
MGQQLEKMIDAYIDVIDQLVKLSDEAIAQDLAIAPRLAADNASQERMQRHIALRQAARIRSYKFRPLIADVVSDSHCGSPGEWMDAGESTPIAPCSYVGEKREVIHSPVYKVGFSVGKSVDNFAIRCFWLHSSHPSCHCPSP